MRYLNRQFNKTVQIYHAIIECVSLQIAYNIERFIAPSLSYIALGFTQQKWTVSITTLDRLSIAATAKIFLNNNT